MEFHIVLALLCIVAACCLFLGHAAGYRRGIVKGRIEGRRQMYCEMDAKLTNVTMFNPPLYFD